MCEFTGRYIRHESQSNVTWVEWVWGSGEGLVGVVQFSVVWNFWEAREGWCDKVPLDRCLIETDSPYLGAGGRIECLVHILGMRGWGIFKGINVPRKMVGAILAQNFRDFYGVA